MTVDTTKPLIKAVEARSDAELAASEAAVAGASSVFSALSQAVDLAKMALEELRVFLFNRIAIGRHAATRASSVFGRSYNRMSGEDPDYVELSGRQLAQVLDKAQVGTKSAIDPSGRYKLRRDVVQSALDRVELELGQTAR